MSSDTGNIAIYVGMDQTLSLLNRPASERSDALEKYPRLDSAPPSLIFELILNLSEAGEVERANKLFHNRFFAREEGGTNVRQVWIEVQLQRALALAKSQHCADALESAQNLLAPVPDLDFTHDGLETILQSARTRYLLGSLYTTCGKKDEAHKSFAAAMATDSSPDQAHWAWLAAKEMPNFNQTEWQARLHTALEQAKSRSETSSYPGWWYYTAGILQEDLGQDPQPSFRQALLAPDRMLSYHFTRLAMSQAKP
jgi:tetratricopeptide (TPR) repeat protein